MFIWRSLQTKWLLIDLSIEFLYAKIIIHNRTWILTHLGRNNSRIITKNAVNTVTNDQILPVTIEKWDLGLHTFIVLGFLDVTHHWRDHNHIISLNFPIMSREAHPSFSDIQQPIDNNYYNDNIDTMTQYIYINNERVLIWLSLYFLCKEC